MRDLLLLAMIVPIWPLAVWKPAYGALGWAWLSLMNPHRFAYGFAYSFPFAYVTALATFAGLLFTKEPRRLKGGAAAFVLALMVAWMGLSTLFALQPDSAKEMMTRVFKIQIFTFISLLVLYKREHVLWLVWTVAFSIGFYGLKGGLFTIATAGNYRVWGPADSFIADNNALALAQIMIIPLWVYLFILYKEKRWMRWALGLAILLCSASAIGSYSRGAFLAIAAMALLLWIKGKKKVLSGIALVLIGLSLTAFMPDQWNERMNTIGTYKEDASAQGRIAAWHMLFNVASDRPLVGGGFEPYSHEVYQRYYPEYREVLSAHSIWFQVMGEHGFVGLALFLTFWALTWRIGSRIIKATDKKPELAWAFWLARMVHVSLVGYFVGGSFLNLAYWDLPYYLMVLLAVTWYAINQPKPSPEVQAPTAQPADRYAGTARGGFPLPPGAGRLSIAAVQPPAGSAAAGSKPSNRTSSNSS